MCQCRHEMPGSCPGEGNCPAARPDPQDAVDTEMTRTTDEHMAALLENDHGNLTSEEQRAFFEALADLMCGGPSMTAAKAIYHALADAVERKAIERIEG